MKKKRGANQPLNPIARVINYTGKISPEEALDLEPKILHFAQGNRSLYVRAALLNYKPKKEDFKK